MRRGSCARCGGQFAMNEMFTLDEEPLCGACAEAAAAEQGEQQLEAEALQRQIDPTICVRCGADNGSVDWPLVAGLSVCATCEDFFRRRPYPTWLKVAFIALLGVAVGALVRNWRFLQGHVEATRANRAMMRQNVAEAARLMGSAARRVPESQGLNLAAAYYRALHLLGEEKAVEAARVLNECRQAVPADMMPADLRRAMDSLLLVAEAGAAFEQKDYDQLLAKALAMAERSPNDRQALAAVSSAYACKYAATGKEEFRQQALEHLTKASALEGDRDPRFPEYEDRIRHRLETREILSPKEFKQRFPQGWKKGQA